MRIAFFSNVLNRIYTIYTGQVAFLIWSAENDEDPSPWVGGSWAYVLCGLFGAE